MTHQLNLGMKKRQALKHSLDELTQCFEKHSRLIQDGVVIVNGETETDYKQCNEGCPYRNEFKASLIDTIKILEGTRKSFKSKQIEALRKKLVEKLVTI